MKPQIGFDPSQASTWRGILWLIISAGVTGLEPDHLRWFLPLSLLVVGLFGVFVKDVPEQPPIIIDRDKTLDDVVRRNQE